MRIERPFACPEELVRSERHECPEHGSQVHRRIAEAAVRRPHPTRAGKDSQTAPLPRRRTANRCSGDPLRRTCSLRDLVSMPWFNQPRFSKPSYAQNACRTLDRRCSNRRLRLGAGQGRRQASLLIRHNSRRSRPALISVGLNADGARSHRQVVQHKRGRADWRSIHKHSRALRRRSNCERAPVGRCCGA